MFSYFPFIDVAPLDWLSGPVLAAVNGGIVGSYPDNTFRPNNPLTRQEAAKIINKVKGIDEATLDLHYPFWLHFD